MYKALIIDDERPVRIAISKLGDWNHFHIEMPEMAENGKDALEKMQSGNYDICFVDMQMPVMNGSMFLQECAREFPDTGVIVISGYDDFSYVQNAIRCGAVDYLLKPIVKSELDLAIEKAIRKIHPDVDFSSESEDSNISAEDVIAMIHNTIDANYRSSIQISDFSDKYFFSREYLSKLFKAKYECSIYEYLIRVRMEHARELLLDPDRKILDIAQAVGYGDTNYFSKAFRNCCGITPSEFRKQNNCGE